MYLFVFMLPFFLMSFFFASFICLPTHTFQMCRVICFSNAQWFIPGLLYLASSRSSGSAENERRGVSVGGRNYAKQINPQKGREEREESTHRARRNTIDNPWENDEKMNKREKKMTLFPLSKDSWMLIVFEVCSDLPSVDSISASLVGRDSVYAALIK